MREEVEKTRERKSCCLPKKLSKTKKNDSAPTASSTLCPPSQLPFSPALPCGTGGAPYAHATNDTSLLASAGGEERGRRDLAESGRTSVVTATGHETSKVRSFEEEGEGAGAGTVSAAFLFVPFLLHSNKR